MTNKKFLDKKWTTFFYKCNVSFNISSLPSFGKAMRAISKLKCVCVHLKYNDVQMRLLKEAKTNITKQVEENNYDSLQKYRGTICIDGWSDVTNRPLLNVVLVCLTHEQSLGSIDTSREVKDADYMFHEMLIYILTRFEKRRLYKCTSTMCPP